MTEKELNAIPIKVGGFTLTLGELKNKLPHLAKVEESRAELDEQRATLELQRVDHARRIAAIYDRFGGALPAGAMQAIERDHEAFRAREAQYLHVARPQWGEPTYRAAQIARMIEVAKPYGVSERDVNAITDHRMLLMLQDFAALKAATDEARAAARAAAHGGDKVLQREASAPPAGVNGSTRRQNSHAQTVAAVQRIISRR